MVLSSCIVKQGIEKLAGPDARLEWAQEYITRGFTGTGKLVDCYVTVHRTQVLSGPYFLPVIYKIKKMMIVDITCCIIE